jgi:DNA polymerase III delta subunit
MAEVVLITGDELLSEDALLEEREKALEGLDPAWVLTELGPGPGFADGLGSTATLGLGEDRRVVVVRRAGALDSEGWDSLVSYVGTPPAHVTLVIEGQGWSSPARSRALSDRVRAVGGKVRREDLPPPSKRADMVREKATARGLRLDAGAARYLVEYLGEEIGNLGAALDQLLAVGRPGARLTEEDVARVFQGARHGPQWDITDALERGDAATALELVHGALEHMHPLQLHAAIVTHYRRVLTVAGRDLSPDDIADELGVSRLPAQKLAQQAKRLGPEGARRAYELLADADVALRGGSVGLDERAVIDILVVQLANVTRSRGA